MTLPEDLCAVGPDVDDMCVGADSEAAEEIFLKTRFSSFTQFAPSDRLFPFPSFLPSTFRISIMALDLKHASTAIILGLAAFKLLRTLTSHSNTALKQQQPSAGAPPSDDAAQGGEVRLTKLVKASGCAAKLSPVVLRAATQDLKGTTDPRL